MRKRSLQASAFFLSASFSTISGFTKTKIDKLFGFEQFLHKFWHIDVANNWAVPESQHCCVQVEFWKRKNFTSWENIKISYKNKIYNHCRTKFTICSKEKINNQMQRQNWQPATKTKFTTSFKDNIYNQLQRQNLRKEASFASMYE